AFRPDYSGGRTAQDSSLEPGSSDAVRRSSDTQNEMVSPVLRSVNLTFLPSMLTPASGAGLKLKVERRSPLTFSSSTVVRSALLRNTRALNLAYFLPSWSRASRQAAGASGYFARNSELYFTSVQAISVPFAISS